MNRILRPFLLCVGLLSAARLLAVNAAENPQAHFTNRRHAYVRGEKARLDLVVAGAKPGARVRFDASGWLPAEAPASSEVAYTLDTAPLRAGDYDVHAVVEEAGRETTRATFSVSVVAERNPQRYPVYRWGGVPTADFSYWTARGFNGCTAESFRDPAPPGSAIALRLGENLDEAARQGLDYGAYLYPIISPRWDTIPEAHAIGANGKSLPQVYPRQPQVVEHAEQTAQSWVDLFAEYPAWTHSLICSEFQLFGDYSALGRKLALDEAGVDIDRAAVAAKLAPADQPKDGLIADDNPHYRFMKWWFHRGMGDAALNERMARPIRAKRPDVLLWHDPYRLAPVFGSHHGLDALSTWTYCQPDMRRMLYTTVMQAAARPEHQKVMQTVTLFLYGRFAVPLGKSTAVLGSDQAGQDPYYTAGPDFAREATWLAFSQRPDLLGYYAAGNLSPYLPGLDPDIASPETYDAIGETARSLVAPFGPMVLAGKRPHAPVAVLMSAAATWFTASPSNAGYPNEQILPYCGLLAMNHVPFEVVLDEDVASGRLSEYSTLVLPRADTLTRKVYEQILAFQKRGGKVIADSSLRAALPGAIVTKYDFNYQRQVDGKALAEGKAITAEEDRRRTEEYAADLRPHLAGIPRQAWASSPRVVVQTLDCGAAKAVFLVNDNRTYGPRFGEYKLHMEKGVRLDTDVSIVVEGHPTLYDALGRREIDYKLENGAATFKTSLPAARGRLVLVYPEPLKEVKIEVPALSAPGKVTPIRIRVLGASGKAVEAPHPLRIDISDPLRRTCEYSRDVACTNGVYELPFRTAVNDASGSWTVRVTDQVSGKTATATFAR